MENLPTPLLGDVYTITIASSDLDTSFEFYTKLGFHEVFRSDWPFPMILITDGSFLVLLRKNDDPFISLTYYVKELDKIVSLMEGYGMLFSIRPAPTDMIKRYVMRSPDGLNISLVSWVEGFAQPTGPTMLRMPQGDLFKPEKYVNQVCGMFGEFAHPVKDLDASIAFWEKLGFKTLSKFTSPYPWAIISDGLSVVGLHQTTTFDYPAITFFASDMAEKIQQIKNNGIDVTAEIGKANVVLLTPEKQHINLFKMGF